MRSNHLAELNRVNLNLTTFGEKKKKWKRVSDGGISIFLIRRKTIVEW